MDRSFPIAGRCPWKLWLFLVPVFACSSAGAATPTTTAAAPQATPSPTAAAAPNAIIDPALLNDGGLFGTVALRGTAQLGALARQRQAQLLANLGYTLPETSLYFSVSGQMNRTLDKYETPGVNTQWLGVDFEDTFVTFGNNSVYEAPAQSSLGSLTAFYSVSAILPTSRASRVAGTRGGLTAGAGLLKPFGRYTLILTNDVFGFWQRFETANVAGTQYNEIGANFARARVASRVAPKFNLEVDGSLYTSLRHSGLIDSVYRLSLGFAYNLGSSWLLSTRFQVADALLSPNGFFDDDTRSLRVALIHWI